MCERKSKIFSGVYKNTSVERPHPMLIVPLELMRVQQEYYLLGLIIFVKKFIM